MSDARGGLQRIVVAGDGQTGTLAAIALRLALPDCEIIVIGTPPDPTGWADRLGTALPFTNRLHDRLGVDEDALVREAGATHRLITRYIGWGQGQPFGMAPYGSATDIALKSSGSGADAMGASWADQFTGTVAPAQRGMPHGSLAEALADAGRFCVPEGTAASPLAELDYALRWNVPAYRSILVARARELGIAHAAGAIAAVQPNADGGIASVSVQGHGEIPADLFIDCTGPKAVLLASLPAARREDWSAYMPIRRLYLSAPGQALAALEDRISLTSGGWLAEFAGRDGLLTMFAAPETLSEEAAVTALGVDAAGFLPLAPGRAADPWVGNVIALGDAAAHFEPLGFYNLDLAHRQLALLLDMVPGRVIDPLERAEFNRRASLMAERVRDALGAHYAAPAARETFGPLQVSAELSLVLDQFTRRSRVPLLEESALLVQEQAALLLALGHEAGLGPVAQAADPRAKDAARAAFAEKSRAALAFAPPYGEWLGRILAGEIA